MAYVFTEPPGGWRSETQAAKLTASTGVPFESLGGSVAVSGHTVLAGALCAKVGTNVCQGAVYVFTRPPSGWSGTRHQAAKLTTKMTAQPDLDGYQLGHSVAISGQTIVAGAPLANVGPNTTQGGAYAFTEPAGGWSGALHETTELIASDGATNDQQGSSVAVSDQTAVVGGGSAVHVFSERKPAGWPTASKVSLGGLATRTARLGFRLRVGANAPRIESLRVSLPRGLSFSHNHAQLANGLAIVGAAKYTFSLGHGMVRVALSKPADGLSVMIRGPAVAETNALEQTSLKLLAVSLAEPPGWTGKIVAIERSFPPGAVVRRVKRMRGPSFLSAWRLR